MKNKRVLLVLFSCMLFGGMVGACDRKATEPTLTATTVPKVSMVPAESQVSVELQSGYKVPQAGTWQLKNTTEKIYIILGTDDDNTGNSKFFRLLRTYHFPYTMNTEAENVRKGKELGPDTDDTIFTAEDAPALFPDGVDVVTLGKYLYDNDLGEVAQHGASNRTLWDSKNLTGDFLTSLHAKYMNQGGMKTEEELYAAIKEQLSETDGSQGASYVAESRVCLEDAFGFPIYTVGIWGGSPVAVVDGIECNLNRIKGVSNFDWRAENYLSAGTVLGSQKKNNSTYDLSRITCGVDEVVSYIEKIEPGKACEFFWHMPFQDEPDITKWRTLFDYIRSLVDSGKAEVVTRRQYAELGEWVENPITKISIDRPVISLGEIDSEDAYTVTATYADSTTETVSEEAILNRSAVNTDVCGTYTVTATYRGVQTAATVSVIDTKVMSEGLGFELLSNGDSYVYGYYKHWGGEFAEATEAVCATELVAAPAKEYYYYTNDPRVVVTIQQYDKDKKWIVPKEEYRKLQRGTKVVLEDNTEYLSVTLRSTVWGIDVKKLFESGLMVGFVSEEPDFMANTTEPRPKNEMQDLTATQFMEEMTVGWNLGNSLDCKMRNRGLDANVKQELAWFNPFVEKSMIDYVAEQGFHTIRIPVTWYYNTGVDENGNLVIGEAFLARVKQVVDYAIDNDLYVIINSHHDEEMIYAGVDDAEMEQVYKDAEALWRQIATCFREYDEHLIFEAYNEVDNRELSWTFGEKAAMQMNRLNQIFVETVRSTGGNNENRILMVPTLINKYNEQMLKAFVVPEDTANDRLIVSVHGYSKAFSQAIENDFILMENYSRQWGVPIIVGEFGTKADYFEPALRTIHATNYIARAAEHGIKCIWWDNGGDFGIIDRVDYSKSDKEMIEALFLGLEGRTCEIENEILLTEPEDYADGTVRENELVVNRFWGTIATDRNGQAIPIPEGSKCMLNLTAQGETSEVWMVSVAFYDKNGEVVPVITKNGSQTTTTIKSLFWTCDVPEGACYIRVSMHSPFTSISREVFDQSLEDGKLELSVSVFDPEDVRLN